MNFKDLYQVIDKNRYYVFSKNDLLTFFPQEKTGSLKKAIYRWKKKKWISPLKKGIYELTYPKDFLIPDMYVANHLYGPSYVSLETALSNYSIIPEVSLAVTSVTTKPTRRFKNKHGLFIYRTIRPAAFTGYYIEKVSGFDVLMAEPEKAIVDFLYLKAYHNKELDLEAERLDKDRLAGLKRVKLDKYAKLYGIDLEKTLYAYL
ncbi:MAG: hypothetical protein Q8R31_01815 [Candidatus Omnitrophota bacterium]|nr:hypothetical protein [Candidatus Omnitrophota bacterium]